MRQGDYGYDAPYFPAIFGFLSVAAAIAATSFWRQGLSRPAWVMTGYFCFFAGNNTGSFL